jgi:hypothetical protein
MQPKIFTRVLICSFAALWLSGCDGLSTGVISKSSRGAMLRWHDKDQSDWSAAFEMPVDRPQALLRAPFRNMSDIGVKDGDRWLHVEPADMARLHNACDRGPLCVVTYLGNGKLRVARTAGF